MWTEEHRRLYPQEGYWAIGTGIDIVQGFPVTEAGDDT